MDAKTIAELLKLPWATLVTLACGYMGYFIAHVGVRGHHKAIDVTFSTLVFGFVAAFGYQVAQQAGEGMLLAALFAAAVSCIAGALWSVVGRRLLGFVMRSGRISLSDDDPSAWAALFRQTSVSTLQLSVKLKDGTWLKTDDLSKFERSLNGPCVLGGAGDILMYVTHQKSPTDEDFEEVAGVQDPHWGEEITFIPQDQIARIDIRRKR